MSKSHAKRLAAADPSHPDHRLPVWDTGDVARYCGSSSKVVIDWAENELLVPASESRTPTGRVRRRYRPADVIAATVVVRRPGALFPKQRADQLAAGKESPVTAAEVRTATVAPPLTAGSPVLFRLPNGLLCEAKGSLTLALAGRNGKPAGAALVFDLGPAATIADVKVQDR